MKQLTVTIPAYNSEKFIEKGLQSYVYEDGSIDPRLQLIIVNDGSTDGTAGVAGTWVSRYPDNIVLIDKENGGHGSGINAGAAAAEGRYFKVIDSDDWIVTENLCSILDELEDTQADCVLTGYHTVNTASGVTLPYGTGQLVRPSSEDVSKFGENYAALRCFGSREVTLEELMEDVDNIPAAQSFHGIMYRTDFYRQTGIKMSEKVFFEDQEYAILPFAFVESVLLLPYYLYEYQTGSADQSVNFANQAKRSPDFLAVVKKMISFHLETDGLSEAQDAFIEWRLSNAAASYYATVLVKGTDKEEGRRLAEEFRAYLEENEPGVAARTERKYRAMLRLNSNKAVSKLYAWLFNSKLFAGFKKRWTR